MITSYFMVNNYHFRPEFQIDFEDMFWSYNCLQAIDAPELLLAGATQRVEFLTMFGQFCAGPILIHREDLV